jgi:hypothetical protein
MSCTDPNRVTWLSGTVNVPGSKQQPGQGGPVLDNNRTPGTYFHIFLTREEADVPLSRV